MAINRINRQISCAPASVHHIKTFFMKQKDAFAGSIAPIAEGKQMNILLQRIHALTCSYFGRKLN
jgi:hypothetical protein